MVGAGQKTVYRGFASVKTQALSKRFSVYTQVTNGRCKTSLDFKNSSFAVYIPSTPELDIHFLFFIYYKIKKLKIKWRKFFNIFG